MSDIPSQMRGVVFNSYGKADELVQVETTDVPSPQPNEVLVKVKAASINPADIKLISGYFRLLSEYTFPSIAGFNLSGIIVGLGDTVRTNASWAIGDEILGQTEWFVQNGSMAEYTCVPVSNIYKKPGNLSWVEAAAIPCVCCASYQALVTHGAIAEGNKVMILGGTTATGMMGIQMAKAFGASFVACTSRNEELCKELGADAVVNYREADWSEVFADTKFDIVYDCIGGYDSYQKAQSRLVSYGRYSTLGGDSPSDPLTVSSVASMMGGWMSRGFWSMFGYPKYMFFDQDKRIGYAEYMPLFEDGSLRMILDPRTPYTFDNVQQMFADQDEGKAKGKLVLMIDP